MEVVDQTSAWENDIDDMCHMSFQTFDMSSDKGDEDDDVCRGKLARLVCCSVSYCAFTALLRSHPYQTRSSRLIRSSNTARKSESACPLIYTDIVDLQLEPRLQLSA